MGTGTGNGNLAPGMGNRHRDNGILALGIMGNQHREWETGIGNNGKLARGMGTGTGNGNQHWESASLTAGNWGCRWEMGPGTTWQRGMGAMPAGTGPGAVPGTGDQSDELGVLLGTGIWDRRCPGTGI